MKTFLSSTLALALVMLAVPSAQAQQNVYRCSGQGSVSYQWEPCAAEQSEKVVLTAAPFNVVPDGEAAARVITIRMPHRPAAEFRTQVRSGTPYVGISDSAVLNMKGWGRPDRISRQRGKQAWLEHWTYTAPDGSSRHLHFANSLLLTMNNEPAPPVQVADAGANPAR